MQTVEIVIRNNKYKISCQNEKKDHLFFLVNRFDKLVNCIAQKTNGKGSDALNFLLAALTLEDRIIELNNELHRVNQDYRFRKKTEYTEILDKVNKVITNLEQMKK